jgi:hypothetical protein
VKAVDQWKAVVSNLPEGWEEARLAFEPEDERSLSDAAAVLGPLGPGRAGAELRFHVSPSGPAGAESVRNLLTRLDQKRIWGELRLLGARVATPAAAHRDELVAEARQGSERVGLVEAWDRTLSSLPPDWSDALCELRVDSSDYLPRAALLGAPLNPARNPDELALRFRVGRKGYGTSAAMARRCFERMDAEEITGTIGVVNGLSDVSNAATLGPVWRIAGRSV